MNILRAMINGKKNQSKIQRIYEEYKNTMFIVAYDISKNPYDADDIVADSMIKVMGILSTIDLEDIDKRRRKNLMITITKNTAIDFLRKKENMPIPYEYIENQRTDKSMEERYIEIEEYESVMSCINEMDDKYRDVLRLRVLHHLNSKEIGEILHISEHNVNVRFMRAKAILAKKLEERDKNE